MVLIKNVLTCQKKINIYSIGTVIQRTVVGFASFVKFAFPELLIKKQRNYFNNILFNITLHVY